MINYNILVGTVDVSVVVRIIDSADGTPETGVVFNTSGIDMWYRRELAASVDITEATLAALTTAHSDGGFLHINDGYYRLDLPDAACASGVAGVLVGGIVTGMIVIGCYINLTPVPVDVRQLLGTAWLAPGTAGTPDVNTKLAGGTTWGSGAITAGAIATDAITSAKIAADAIGASELAADAIAEIADAVWDEDATGHQTTGTFGQAIGDPVADTNTIYKAVVTDAAGANIAVDIVAIEAQTDDIGTAGAGLTAIPWNASWDAEVQSEATDALNAYDPPTKAELDAAVAGGRVA